MKNKNTNPTILIIGNLYDDPIPLIALDNLVKILKNVFVLKVIAGNIYEKSKEKNNFDRNKSSIIKIILESIKRQIKVIKLINETDFDESMVLLPFLIIPILYIKIIKKKPVILYIGGMATKSIHGEIKSGSYSKIPIYLIMKLIEILSFFISDLILVDSNPSIEFLGLKRYVHKIKIYPSYVNIEKYKNKKEIKDREIVLGYLGRLDKEKGICEFIYAANLIANLDLSIKFIIGGIGNLQSEVQNFVDSSENLNGRVDFLGWVDHDEEMPNILNDLYLLILPSYSEGTPNIVLEAMACGTPVLSTPVGGVADIIVNGENGFIIRRNDPETICETVLDILNREDLNSISKNAINTIEEKFSRDMVIQKYNQIF